MTSRLIGRRTFTTFASASCVAAAFPAVASIPKTLRIGTVLLTKPLGPVQPSGALQATQSLIDRVNRDGGIAGAKIELLVENDQFNPVEHAAKVRAMAADPSLLAFLHPLGTRQVAATLDAVQDIAVVGPISGAPALRENIRPNVFWTRVTFADEIDSLLKTAKALAIKTVGLVYPNEALGHWMLEALSDGCKKYQLTVAATAPMASTVSLEVDAPAKIMATAKPELVIMGVNTSALLVKALREGGYHGSIFGLSLGAGADNLSAMGEHARGVGFSLHVPSPTALKYQVIRNYQSDLKAAGIQAFDVVGVEAYLSTSVLVYALKRISGNYNRHSVIQALEGISNLDLGGVRFRFGKGIRTGTDFVTVATVNSEGRLMI